MTLTEHIGKSIEARTYTRNDAASLIILMRHGHAAYTYEEDHGGNSFEGTLKEEGKERVAESAEEILSVLEKYAIARVHIVVSPKNRCIESAGILEHILVGHAILVSRSVDPALRDVKAIGPTANREGSYVRWEKDMREGENWFASWMRKAKEGMEFYPGEESPQDVEKRVSAILPKYFTSNITTILVCHEETFGAIASALHVEWTRPTYGEVWYMKPKLLK